MQMVTKTDNTIIKVSNTVLCKLIDSLKILLMKIV